MINHNTVSVDILVKASVAGAANNFRSELRRIESDTRAWVGRMNALFGRLKMPGSSFAGMGGGMAAGVAGRRVAAGVDPAMARAQADIGRMVAQRSRWESDYTRHVQTQAERQYRARVSSMQRSAQDFQRILNQNRTAESRASGGSFGGSIAAGVFGGSLAANAVTAVTAATVVGGKAILDYSSKLEQAKIGFETMTGSAVQAQKHLQDLQLFAAKTPFQFDELVSASQKLQGVGIEAERVIPILNDVGNSLAAAGRIGDLPFAIKALGDIQAKGRLAGQEIIQLANTGIPIRAVLAKQLNVTQEEVIRLGEAGQISSEMVFEGLRKMSQERFGDAMLKQSKTFSGAMSNVYDAVMITSSKAFAPLYERISRLASDFADEIISQQGEFRDVGAVIAKYIVAGLTTILSEGIRAGIGLIIDEIKDPTKWYDAILSGIGSGIKDSMISLGIADPSIRNMPVTYGDYKKLTDQRESSLVKMNATAALNDIRLGTNFSGFLNADRTVDLNKIISKNLTDEQNTRAIEDAQRQLEKVVQTAKDVPSMADELKSKQAAMEARELADAMRKLSLQRAEAGFGVARARIALRPENTEQERIANARALSSAQAAFIREQIKNQREGYDAEIELNKDNTLIVKKLQLEKQAAIEKLNTDLVLNELETQREIMRAEQEAYRRRREAAIQFKEIQLDLVSMTADKMLFDLEKNLAAGTLKYEQAYSRQIEIERNAYNEQIKLTRERLAIQLKDETLSTEEKANMRLRAYATEQRMALEHGQKVFDIQQKQLEDQRRLIQNFTDSAVQSIESAAALIDTALSAIFGPGVTGGRMNAVFDQIRHVLDQQRVEIKNEIVQLEQVRQNWLDSRTPSAPAVSPSGQKPLLRPNEIIIPTSQPGMIYDAVTGQMIQDPTSAQMLSRMSAADRAKLAQSVPQRVFPPGVQTITIPEGGVSPVLQVPIPSGAPDITRELASAQNNADMLADRIQFLRDAHAEIEQIYAQLGRTMSTFEATAQGVDQLAVDTIKANTQARLTAIDAQIDGQTRIIEKTQDERQVIIESMKLADLQRERRAIAVEGLKAEEDAYRDSIKGLTAYNEALAKGDKIATAFAENKAIRDRLKEEAGLREELIRLRDLQYNSGTLNNLQIEVQLERDKLEILNRERDAVIDINRARLEIAEQTVYSANQADAAVLKFMASQKGVTQIMADFKIGLLESGYDLIDRGLDKIIPKMGRLSGVIKELLSSFIKLGINWAFRKLFGLDSTSGGGGRSGGGGNWLQNILSALGGRGTAAGTQGGSLAGVGIGGTPPFNPLSPSIGIPFGGGATGGGSTNPFAGTIFSALTGGGQLAPTGSPTIMPSGAGGILGQVTQGAGSVAQAAGKTNWLGKLINSPGFAGALAGGTMGLGLGVGIGGGRGFSGVLGGIGGALAGGAAGVMVSGLLMGGLKGAAMFAAATPFAIIGAGILLAAFFLGRRARAKREKKQVNAWFSDAEQRIRQLIEDVKAFKISGSEAYSAGMQIRDQFAQQITQLKDKGAKRLAQQKLGVIDGLLGTLKTEGDRADRLRNIARVTDEKVVPTYHSGGFTGMAHGSQHAILDSNEAVLRQQDIMAIGGYRTLRKIGVRGINLSGAPDTDRRSAYSRANRDNGSDVTRPIYVIPVYSETEADAMMDKVSPLGIARKVKVAAKGNLAGMVETFAEKLTGR